MREIWYVFDKTGFSAGAVIIDPQPVRRIVAMGRGDQRSPQAPSGSGECTESAPPRVRTEPGTGLAARRERARLVILRPQGPRALDGLPPAA